MMAPEVNEARLLGLRPSTAAPSPFVSMSIATRLRGLTPRVDQVRFELTAFTVQKCCSTNWSYKPIIERIPGVEPGLPVWKTGVIPLDHTR